MQSQQERKQIDLSNGEQYAYFDLGDSTKKPIVLLHGNSASSASLDRFFEGLKNDFRLVAPDMRGYGLSTYNTPIKTLEDLADDIKLFVDALGLKSFALFGWSLGGGVCLKFSAKYPDYVEKLILHNSMGISGSVTYKMEGGKFTDERVTTIDDLKNHPITLMSEKRNREKNTAEMIRGLKSLVWNGIGIPSEEKQKIYGEEGVLQRNYTDIRIAMNFTFNMSDKHNGIIDGTGEYKNIKCKILAFAGKKDLVSKYTEDMKQHFGDQMQLFTIIEGGHASIEDMPNLVLGGIKDFAKL